MIWWASGWGAAEDIGRVNGAQGTSLLGMETAKRREERAPPERRRVVESRGFPMLCL